MTKKELEHLVAELQTQLTASKQPSTIRRFWNRAKPSIIPFILGMILGGFAAYSAAVCGLPSVVSQTSLEKQAALGGAVIPFPSGNPSPSLSASPPSDSNVGTADSSLTTPSEPPLLNSPQADNGQTPSTRLFRPLIRQIR